MAEYTTNWTPEKVEKFKRYDLNGDGIITADECLKVVKGTSGSR
jgi:Ca2+-binding EF-hand superfamily protein